MTSSESSRVHLASRLWRLRRAMAVLWRDLPSIRRAYGQQAVASWADTMLQVFRAECQTRRHLRLLARVG